jgi:hypothetical protein
MRGTGLSLLQLHDLVFGGLEFLAFLDLALLKLLEMHVEGLRIILDLFDSFDDFLLKYLLALFHFVNLFVKGFLAGALNSGRFLN